MIKLRNASLEDCDLLFRWANDEEVRKNSFNTEIIKYEDHKMWFFSILENKDILLYVMEIDNIPVGQVRVNIDNYDGIISYSISKDYRRKKLGIKIIKLIERELNNLNRIDRIVAYVKKDNEASKRVFTKLIYSEVILNDKNLYYKIIKR